MTSWTGSSVGEPPHSSEQVGSRQQLGAKHLVPPKAPSSQDTTGHCGSIDCSKFDSSPALPDECACTSTIGFAPNNFVPQSSITEQSLLSATHTKPGPIRIPLPNTLHSRDINRVPTPLTGRGEHKGHCFPFSQSPSPRAHCGRSFGKSRTSSEGSHRSEEFFGRLERARSASPSITGMKSPVGSLSMNESLAVNRYPTSPLSPKPSSKQHNLSPQNSIRKGNHGRQMSRNMQTNLGRYHPSNFLQADTLPSPTSSMQAPQITYNRAPPAVQMESPRLLRDKHREFLQKQYHASKLAASPFSTKPEAPRLDPLGSPKGPVTPLELEADDYFSVAGARKRSPASSPGSRSPRGASMSPDDEINSIKSRKVGK